MSILEFEMVLEDVHSVCTLYLEFSPLHLHQGCGNHPSLLPSLGNFPPFLREPGAPSPAITCSTTQQLEFYSHFYLFTKI